MFRALLVVIVLGQNYVPGPDGIMVPDIPLFNKKPEPFIAPGRLFAVEVPPGWGVALHEDDPYTIDFKGVGRPGNGILQIRRILVPKDAHTRQLILNALETRLSKLPNFKVASRRDVKIAGHRAAAIVGTYSYKGNIQYPLAIEEVYVVTGAEAFVFHFECFEPLARELAPDLNRFYTSFQPRPPGMDANPFAVPDSPPGQINPDQVRF